MHMLHIRALAVTEPAYPLPQADSPAQTIQE